MLDFMKEKVPDTTTLLHFRRVLEESELGKAMFEAINRELEVKGHFMRGGTIVDATIISAPPSGLKSKVCRSGLSVSGFRI